MNYMSDDSQNFTVYFPVSLNAPNKYKVLIIYKHYTFTK